MRVTERALHAQVGFLSSDAARKQQQDFFNSLDTEVRDTSMLLQESMCATIMLAYKHALCAHAVMHASSPLMMAGAFCVGC